MDLTMAFRHCSPLEPPDLQMKAALMEVEVQAVTDGDGNRGGGGGVGGALIKSSKIIY